MAEASPNPQTPAKDDRPKPLEGSLKTQGLDSLAAWVAQRALERCAREIAGQVLTVRPERVLVLEGTSTLPDDLSLLEIELRLEQLKTLFVKQVKSNEAVLPVPQPLPAETLKGLAFLPPPLAAPAITATLLSAVQKGLPQTAETLGFFRTDTDIAGSTLEPSNRALRWTVAGDLSVKTEAVLLELSDLQASKLLSDYQDALEARLSLEVSAARLVTAMTPLQSDEAALKTRLEQARVKGDTASGTALEAALTALQHQIFEFSSRADASAVLLKSFAAYQAWVTAPAPGQTHSPLALAAVRRHALSLGATHVLALSVGSSAGESIAQRSIWPWSNAVHFLGAVSAEYALTALSDGLVKGAGLVTASATASQNPDRPGLTVRGDDLGAAETQPGLLIGLGLALLVVMVLLTVLSRQPLLLPEWVMGGAFYVALGLIVVGTLWLAGRPKG